MKVGDLLYFAPGLRFDQVDLNGHDLPKQFYCRINGLYIHPAEECAKMGHAFAAGVLLMSSIDALARIQFGNGVGKRFKSFAREKLRSFSTENLADRFYSEFRNGLVHECRLKEGGQFSLEFGSTVKEVNGLLLVNPMYLACEVRSTLDAYVDLLHKDPKELTKLSQTLRKDHAKDFCGS